VYYPGIDPQTTIIYMQIRSPEFSQTEIKTEVAHESNSGATSNPLPGNVNFPIAELPALALTNIAGYLSGKEVAQFIRVARNWEIYNFFKPVINKLALIEAKEAAACAIYPVEEGENNAPIYNVTKLKALLKACPALLLHPVSVKNRHGMEIKGTVYQIALHEGDHELVDDVIEPAFKRLNDGLTKMKEQHQAWLPEGWLEAETAACKSAMSAIDNLFAAFKRASNPNDVIELEQRPKTITIHHLEVNLALETFRKEIDKLYQATDKPKVSGRDPIARLLGYFIDRYIENVETLGSHASPRNNALFRLGYGYLQRYAPINFLQAFAMAIFFLVSSHHKLKRKFEYCGWPDHYILPLDSEPADRLGHEYFVGGGLYRPGALGQGQGGYPEYEKIFYQLKISIFICITIKKTKHLPFTKSSYVRYAKYYHCALNRLK